MKPIFIIIEETLVISKSVAIISDENGVRMAETHEQYQFKNVFPKKIILN